jgi:hypothetical protein
MFRSSSDHLQVLLHQTSTYTTRISKQMFLRIVGIINYGVGACAELVCNVIITAYTPLSDNTQHSQQTDIHVSGGFEPAIRASKRLQIDPLDRGATGDQLWTFW